GAAFVDRAVRDAAVDATRADPVVAAGDEVVFDHRHFDAGVDADFFDFLTADELVVRGDVDHAFPVRSQRAFRTGETFFRFFHFFFAGHVGGHRPVRIGRGGAPGAWEAVAFVVGHSVAAGFVAEVD